MEEKKYKLSPSDFAYLYEECKCCFYLKIKAWGSAAADAVSGCFFCVEY